MGLPGSGKGTMANLCTKELGWLPLSTGNLCRQHIKNQTEIGKQIDLIIKSGKLVSDDIVAAMVQDWLQEVIKTNQNILLDGFPRTVKQAELLSDIIKKLGLDPMITMVQFDIDRTIIIDRILHRVMCTNKSCQKAYSMKKDSSLYPKKETSCDDCGSDLVKRSDDTLESIQQRFEMYDDHVKSLLDFYVDQGITAVSVNADRQVQDIFEDIKKIVDAPDARS